MSQYGALTPRIRSRRQKKNEGVRVIRFENVTKLYNGQDRPALETVSLEIVKG